MKIAITGKGGVGKTTFASMISRIDVYKRQVKGIVYRKDGQIIVNEEMELLQNLDEIPSPYENLDVKEYENRIVYYETSRGCPFNCQYCLSSAIKGLRYFSTDRVKRDLKNLIDARAVSYTHLFK